MRTALCLVFALYTMFALGQGDSIVMHINGTPVPLDEFEYRYRNFARRTNGKVTAKDYAERLANDKIKVLAAKDEQLDTIHLLQKRILKYRNKQIRPYLIPVTTIKDDECKNYYNAIKTNLQGKKIIKPAHIFIKLPQNASKKAQEQAKVRIDSAYKALQEGADFAELAKKVSQDNASAFQGGELPWIGTNQTLKEFEDVAFSLKAGEYATPILSTVGYHIIKVIDIKDLDEYETIKPEIQRFLESQRVEKQLSAPAVDAKAEESQKSVEKILDEETDRLCNKDADLKFRLQAYADSLLVHEISARQPWNSSDKDTTAWKNYFEKNKKDYTWKEPRFDGMIYYCREKSDIKAVKKALKKTKPQNWEAAIQRKFNSDSVRIHIEKGLFKPGENANVDVLALKVKKAKLKPIVDFPYAAVMGKKLKKGPNNWSEVGDQVIEDYKQEREATFVAELRKKYTVEFHDNVLKKISDQ